MDLNAWVASDGGQEFRARATWTGPLRQHDADDYGGLEDVEVSPDERVWAEPEYWGLCPFMVEEALIAAMMMEMPR